MLPSVQQRQGNLPAYQYQPVFTEDGEEVEKRRFRQLQDKYFLPLVTVAILLLTYGALWAKGFYAGEVMRHPLAIAPPPTKTDGSLRFLTFGSFDQWGFGMERPTKEAYPFLLDPQVHNAALHVGGPALGAVCTESMTGNGIYDVIVLDFFMNAKQGLPVLARRLRQRFPNALIVIVRRWTPFHLEIELEDGSRMDAIRWKNRNGLGHFTSDTFRKALSETRPEQWHFLDHKEQERIIDETVERVGAVKVELPHPEDWNPFTALTDYIDLFQYDAPRTLSTKGHGVIARRILNEVQKAEIMKKSFAVRNEIGGWGTGDDCHMWYTTGVVSEAVRWSGAKMKHFATQFGNKFALEYPPGKGGSLVVENKFDLPRMLYLTYMTVGASKAQQYPRTKITLGDKPGMTLEPSNLKEERFTHSPRTVAVGLIPSGTTIVTIKPETGMKSKFRLTGWSLFGSTEVPFEHTLELEPADDIGALVVDEWE